MKKISNSVFNHVWAKHSYAEKYKHGSYHSFQFLHQLKLWRKFYLQFSGRWRVLVSETAVSAIVSFIGKKHTLFKMLSALLSFWFFFFIRTEYICKQLLSSILLCNIIANSNRLQICKLFFFFFLVSPRFFIFYFLSCTHWCQYFYYRQCYVSVFLTLHGTWEVDTSPSWAIEIASIYTDAVQAEAFASINPLGLYKQQRTRDNEVWRSCFLVISWASDTQTSKKDQIMQNL